MSILPVRIYGDPVLTTATATVTRVDDELRTLVRDLFDTLDAAKGVGLAANQVGVGLRLFVYDCPDGEHDERRRGVVLNPILETTAVPEGMPDVDEIEEGCLSLPGEAFPTGRAEWARVVGTDLESAPVDIEGHHFFARCLQHEVGHLDGHTYLSRLVGRHARAAKKAVRAQGWGVPGLSWTPGTIADPFGH